MTILASSAFAQQPQIFHAMPDADPVTYQRKLQAAKELGIKPCTRQHPPGVVCLHTTGELVTRDVVAEEQIRRKLEEERKNRSK